MATVASNYGDQNDEDEDIPTLSAHALAALQQFSQEQQLLQSVEADTSMVPENWGMSQFWYDANTSQALAKEVHSLITESNCSGKVACVSCPSLFAQIKKDYPAIDARLLEYDHRFAKYGSHFVYYDFNSPEDLPHELQHSFEVVVADPPYLSEDCLKEISKTVNFLSKDRVQYPVLLLTGAVQQEYAFKLLGLRPTLFRPSHQCKLGNEFKLFTNYDPTRSLGSWE